MVDLMTGDRAEPCREPSARIFHQSERIAMRVEGVSSGKLVRDVSFNVRVGERLGIAGLVGSGRTELLRAIFGAEIATAWLCMAGRNCFCPAISSSQSSRRGRIGDGHRGSKAEWVVAAAIDPSQHNTLLAATRFLACRSDPQTRGA